MAPIPRKLSLAALAVIAVGCVAAAVIAGTAAVQERRRVSEQDKEMESLMALVARDDILDVVKLRQYLQPSAGPQPVFFGNPDDLTGRSGHLEKLSLHFPTCVPVENLNRFLGGHFSGINYNRGCIESCQRGFTTLENTK
jgi:hypothetical protein